MHIAQTCTLRQLDMSPNIFALLVISNIVYIMIQSDNLLEQLLTPVSTPVYELSRIDTCKSLKKNLRLVGVLITQFNTSAFCSVHNCKFCLKSRNDKDYNSKFNVGLFY